MKTFFKLDICIVVLLILTTNTILKSQARWESNVLYNRYIKDLHSVGDKLYAIADEGIYFSTDHGNFWSCLKIDSPYANYYANAIANIGNEIFIASEAQGIFSTDDDGITWSVLNDGLGSLRIISLLSKDSYLFAGSSDNGIFISSNHGISWSVSGLTELSIKAFATDGDKIFAGTSNGVFLSSDNGVSWIARSQGLNTLLVESIFFDSGNLFAGTGEGEIFFSSNFGTNWAERDSGLTNAKKVSCFTSLNNFIFAGTYLSGIFSSSNNGLTWNPVNTGFGLYPRVNSLMIFDNKIFAGMFTFPKGIYFTTNYGASWSNLNSGLTCGRTLPIEGIGNSMLVGTQLDSNIIFKSTNNGATWSSLGEVTPYGVLTSIAFNPSAIFTSVYIFGIYKSTNSGSNWNNILTDSSVESGNRFSDILLKSNYIFVSAQDSGIYRSSDDGISWIRVNSGLSSLYVSTLAVSGNYLLAGTSTGIFYSLDNGNSWEKSQSEPDNINISSIRAIGPYTYASSYTNGILISSDNGSSWESRNNGFETLQFYDVSGNDEILFALHFYDGVYISYDKGVSWVLHNLGFFNTSLFCRFYINDDYVFLTSLSGVYRLKLSDIVGINNTEAQVAKNYLLYQNYPNPFNPQTNIKFEIPGNSFVKLQVYDILGKEIQTLIDKPMTTGIYSIEFNAENLPSGIYFYRIEISDIVTGRISFSKSNKMLLVK